MRRADDELEVVGEKTAEEAVAARVSEAEKSGDIISLVSDDDEDEQYDEEQESRLLGAMEEAKKLAKAAGDEEAKKARAVRLLHTKITVQKKIVEGERSKMTRLMRDVTADSDSRLKYDLQKEAWKKATEESGKFFLRKREAEDSLKDFQDKVVAARKKAAEATQNAYAGYCRKHGAASTVGAKRKRSGSQSGPLFVVCK